MFSLPFLWQRTFLTVILKGNLLKHIQHPHNFDLRSVPQLVTSHTNISQFPDLMLCLLFLQVLCVCDYPWGFIPVWALGWSPLRQYLAPGLFDITAVGRWFATGHSAHVWLTATPPETLFNTSEWHLSVQPVSIYSLGQCIPFLLVTSHISSSHIWKASGFIDFHWCSSHPLGEATATLVRIFKCWDCLIHSGAFGDHIVLWCYSVFLSSTEQM